MVKVGWAQKAKDLVHALSRASFSISCPLHVEKGKVTLRVGEPGRGSSQGKCSSRAYCDSSRAAALHRCYILWKFSASFGCQPALQLSPQSFCPSIYLYPYYKESKRHSSLNLHTCAGYYCSIYVG